MAQALIKSTSNNKPPQQCAGSERAVRWQEPRGSSRRARAKRELCPRRGCKGAGGEGLACAGAAGTFPESRQGAEGLLGDEMVASLWVEVSGVWVLWWGIPGRELSHQAAILLKK